MSAIRLDENAAHKLLLAPSTGLLGDTAVLVLALARVLAAGLLGLGAWALERVRGTLLQ